jgi:acetamidase/formamidase
MRLDWLNIGRDNHFRYAVIVPAEFGGNMDAPEAGMGNTLHLPVNVPGALLFMGDGEVTW